MKNLEQVQTLWSRAKGASHDLAALGTLLDDFKTVLERVMASGDTYRADLRRLHEELPDLQRLITKKHDIVLKGRLQDAISALKKKVESVEAPVEETPAAAETTNEGITVTEEKRHVRNTPNLGME
jgi:hypothetical protein